MASARTPLFQGFQRMGIARRFAGYREYVGALEDRHVDLRPFVFLHGPDDARVLPRGLTRVDFEPGGMVVNSTRDGGAKDTWVLTDTTGR